MAEPFKDYHKVFPPNAPLEVSLNEPGLVGSWFTATVIRPISYRSKTLTVRYDRLITDDGKPLEETVRAVNVRPIPPRETKRSFKIDEDVDAFDEDGWWEGVVVGLVSGSRYEVYFRCSREQLVFREDELRLHREWVYGEWVPPMEEEVEKEEVGEKLARSFERSSQTSADQMSTLSPSTEKKASPSVESRQTRSSARLTTSSAEKLSASSPSTEKKSPPSMEPRQTRSSARKRKAQGDGSVKKRGTSSSGTKSSRTV